MALSKRITRPQPELDPFKPFFAVGEAIATLLHPLAEVVLHDLRTGRVIRIWNSFTERQAGDLSKLQGAEDSFPTDRMILGPYEKALSSQGRTKSITSGIKDFDDNLIGFFCINVNVTMMDAAAAFLGSFASSAKELPKPFYRNDFQQHINYLVRDFSLKISKPIEKITRAERAALVGEVSEAGLFQGRSAVSLLARAMHVSRASVYNILAELKEGAAGDASEAAATMPSPTGTAIRRSRPRMRKAEVR